MPGIGIGKCDHPVAAVIAATNKLDDAATLKGEKLVIGQAQCGRNSNSIHCVTNDNAAIAFGHANTFAVVVGVALRGIGSLEGVGAGAICANGVGHVAGVGHVVGEFPHGGVGVGGVVRKCGGCGSQHKQQAKNKLFHSMKNLMGYLKKWAVSVGTPPKRRKVV